MEYDAPGVTEILVYVAGVAGLPVEVGYAPEIVPPGKVSPSADAGAPALPGNTTLIP